MSDYERIARAIRWIEAHRTEQPTLAALAQAAGLSSFHFHRLFCRWTGATPKDVVAAMTLHDLTARLRAGEPVLSASEAAGLSSPSRAHDLCIQWDALTPGEIRRQGRGVEIVAGFAHTPFGLGLIAESPRGICHLAFAEDRAEAFENLRRLWPEANLREDARLAKAVAERIFGAGPVQACVRGTPFQIRVWRALLEIPEGSAITYGTLARQLGHPRAARAIGQAVGANSLAFLIPCHRVLRESGLLGGYRWGTPRKQALLAWELARQDNGSA